jgi:hypothetical protein
VDYVESKEDPLIQIIRTHQHNTNSALFQTANKFKKSFQSETKQITNIITQNIKGKWEEKRMHGQLPRSLDKKNCGQSYRWLKFGDIKGETESRIVAAQDQAISTNCFKRKILKQETESRIVAAQDQVISTNYFKRKILKQETESRIVAAQDQAISTNCFKRKILKEETESRCRLCKEYEETIDHRTSGCSILTKNEYVIRHDKVCTHLHYSICKH